MKANMLRTLASVKIFVTIPSALNGVCIRFVPVSGKRSTVLAADSRKVSRRPGLINKIAAFVADNQESPGAGLFSDCAARAVSCVINGRWRLPPGYPVIPHSPGVITLHAIEFPGVGAFYQRVPVFTLPRLTSAFFSRTQSSLAEHSPLSSVLCRQNHQAIPCRIFDC